MTKRFRCIADFTFHAEDIDDALLKLAKHFIDEALGEDSQLIEKGKVEVKPVEPTSMPE